jgi:long-chain acyl-CoA synthetase
MKAARKPSAPIDVAGELVNFLENIFDRLARAPERVVTEELRPGGKVSFTAGKLLESVAAARAFFTASGMRRGERVALLAGNCAAWTAVDLAAMAEGLIVVPLYARQSPAELAVMLRDAQPRMVCCGDATLRDGVRGAWGAVSSGGPDAPVLPLLDEVLAGVSVKIDRSAKPAALGESDPVTIIYTSGTSGEPKGVVLTVANVTYILSCTKQRLDQLMHSHPGTDRVFHYLPFCFASSWLVMLSCLSRQSVLRLSSDLTRIADDLRESEPDYCVNVPALLERMRTAIEGQITSRGGMVHKIFRNAQKSWQEKSGGLSLALARAVIFPAIRKKLGGNLKALISGSAPLSAATQQFFMMLGIPVLQVYGLTETTGICTMDDPGRVEPGTVGPAIPGIEMKLGEGEEILVRGPNVFSGYWSRPDQTAAVVANGWFHTGDRGEQTPAGNWRIIGRLKNLLILSSGHNIAPEPLEETLTRAVPGAQQVVVIGHGHSYLTALVTGDVQRDQAEKAVEQANAEVPHYRQIRAFHLEPKPLTIESGMLTANGKLRREAVTAHFAEAIEAMYRKTAEASTAAAAAQSAKS